MKTIIHLNQLGYITEQSKTATVITSRKSFSICEKDTNKIVFTGVLSPPVADIASGDTTCTADFSAFKVRGEYYIKVGTEKSYSFLISDYPYYELSQYLLKAFYFNRCGITIHRQFAGEYRRKKCHASPSSLYSNTDVKIDVTGGWHDAGDYGRYTISGATALGHMLYAYEFFPDSFQDRVNIPESENGIPDILNECKYELVWLLKMQDKDGGVYHKVSAKVFPSNIMPSDDPDEQFVFDKTFAATANFSAVTALAARIYLDIDTKFSAHLQTASLNAWIWILNNPAHKTTGSSYKPQAEEYSDRNYYDDIFWAASELFRLTGEMSFSDKVSDIFDRVDTTAFTWNSVGGFGAISYIFSENVKDPLVLDALKTAFIYKADNIVSMSRHSGYGTAKQGNRYLWGSNMEILTFTMTLIVANILSPNPDYITAALEQINYILGKNPNGISYVTGFGEHACSHPHHRPSTADGIDEPVKGMVTGGPDMLRSDEYSRWLIPKGTPPAKCYIDNEYSYTTNEVAIYCNSPAIFVLGYFNKNSAEEDKEPVRTADGASLMTDSV